MQTDDFTATGRITALRPTAVNNILGEVRDLRAAGRTIISLMRGEPDFPTPPHIVEAATAALKGGRTAYPDNRGERSLREAVSAKLLRDNGLSYDADSEILITDGATLGVYASLMALIGEGDEVLVPDPIYDAYESPIRLAGGDVRRVRGARGRGGRFELSAEALEASWTPAARVLLLNTP
ncbi:MAG TPA: aminotransferase class I/II-fold pyridoxal phosphate-dependent enzyme, partial [Bryobacteraceae bacterium]|nr:aminotransferase class I/II-fold pyridoxal phosphate-dependent enzyme [Bryobacteraceae bacterium]